MNVLLVPETAKALSADDELATYRDVRRLQVLTALLADPDWFPGEEALCARLRAHFESGTPDV